MQDGLYKGDSLCVVVALFVALVVVVLLVAALMAGAVARPAGVEFDLLKSVSGCDALQKTIHGRQWDLRLRAVSTLPT